jgi:hypothetical protein
VAVCVTVAVAVDEPPDCDGLGVSANAVLAAAPDRSNAPTVAALVRRTETAMT